MKLLKLRVTNERICALIDGIMICKIWNDSENVFTKYTIFRVGICFTEFRKIFRQTIVRDKRSRYSVGPFLNFTTCLTRLFRLCTNFLYNQYYFLSSSKFSKLLFVLIVTIFTFLYGGIVHFYSTTCYFYITLFQ